MYTTKKIAVRRDAFTLTEMLVVIAIILAVAALAAAFAPRVNDNQKMTRAVDNLEQWLLTAKMRAKRDGLPTGLRFIQAPGDANIDPSIQSGGPPTLFSQFQYIQQPDPLSGGYINATGAVGGALVSAASGVVTFGNVDFSLGNPLNPPNQWLVQSGDYLEVNGGGVFLIQAVTSPITVSLSGAGVVGSYGNSLAIAAPGTTNYRILRQPRLLIGEEPLALPDNYAAVGRIYPGTALTFGNIPGSGSSLSATNVALGSSGYPEILFAPSGAVIGTNAGTPILCISVWDIPQQMDLASKGLADSNLVGIVGIQSRSGFIGAYSVSLSGNPFLFVQNARESGL
jgi:prepilin-type N-terminal cleavage/methylation domain-containing protein